MKIDQQRLSELKDGNNRASRAIYEAVVKQKAPLDIEILLPIVAKAYIVTKDGKQQLDRTEKQIRKSVERTIRWLTY